MTTYAIIHAVVVFAAVLMGMRQFVQTMFIAAQVSTGKVTDSLNLTPVYWLHFTATAVLIALALVL